MGLNANALASFLQPVKSVNEFIADYDAVDAGKQRNALLQMQVQKAQQGMADQQEVRNVLAQPGDHGQRVNALVRLGAFDQAEALQNLHQQRLKAELVQRQESARQQALRSLMPVQGIDANRVSGVAGPRPEALGVVGQRGRFDPAQMLAAGFAPGEVEKMQGMIDPRTEVKDYQQVRMPDGTVKVVGLTKDGKVVETGQSPFIKPEFQRMGSHVAAIDPATLKSTNVGAINMSAAEAAQDARARQGLGLQAARLAFDKDRATKTDAAGSPTAPGKPLTEAQAKASAFMSQMQSAERELESVGMNQGKLTNQIDVALASSPLNMIASQDAQRVRQSQEQWAEAYLRFKTGAAATEGEVKRNVKTFFPQQGDSAAVIAQKKRMRDQAVSDVGFTATGRQGQTPPQVSAPPKVVDFGSLK